jgi:hypothetical protein
LALNPSRRTRGSRRHRNVSLRLEELERRDTPSSTPVVVDAPAAGSAPVGLDWTPAAMGLLLNKVGVTAAATVSPTVAITAPAAGTSLTGVVPVQATATDNVGVTRVEFYVDGVLHAVQTTPPAASPYTWDWNTADVANGSHTLKVLAYDAAGNVGQASEAVTTQNNTALPRPVIPQHYPQIRIAELAYYGNPMGSFENQMLANSVDLVVSDAAYLQHINSVSPNTPQLIYTNVSNIYQGLVTNWLNYADANGLDREGAFYHAAVPTAFTGNSGASQPVDWFWDVFQGGSTLGNVTARANGTQAGGVTFGAAGQAVYLGYTDPFREINLNLASGAAGGWAGTWQYASAVDASGNPTAWSTLTTLTDTTAGMTQSGQVTFDPPADWKTATLGGSARLYYVRFLTTAAGTAPVAGTILGADYVNAHGTNSGTIPVFDYAADTDHDGYLNNAEYAAAVQAGDTARFAYQSRLFAGNYGQMRFATNPSDAGFLSWAVAYNTQYLNSQPLAAGLFVDNSPGAPLVPAGASVEPLATYSQDYAAVLDAIGKAVAPRWLLTNTAGGGSSADAVIQTAQGYFEEFNIAALANNYQKFESLAAQVAHRAALTSPAPYAVIDSLPTGGLATDPRTQLATLAYYYEVADPATTFLDFFGGSSPGSSWTQHWAQAAAYNIGQPTGTWSVAATGADPANAALTYKVYERTYSNALVLYKPLSYGNGVTGTTADATATTISLAGSYYPLNADGTLGAPVTSVSLRNGEGAILVKAPTAVNDFVVSGLPTSLTAGTSATVTVTAKDQFNNTVTGYTGTVHLSSSDPQAVLPADYTFTAADNGSHTFTVTFKTAGGQSLTAADTTTPWVSGTELPIQVTPAAVSGLQVRGPASAAAGVPLTVTVTAQDAYGNTVPGYTGAVHFSSSDGQAVLPSDYVFTAADAGAHAFGVSLKTAGSQSVTATDKAAGSVTGTQAGISVAPGAATQLGVQAPASATAGVAFGVTVTARDAYGNVAAGYAGTVHFSSSDPAAVLPADYTFGSGDQGAHTFTAGVTLKTGGTQTVTAADTGTSSITGSSSVAVTGAAVAAPTNLTATALSSSKISLSWADNSNNETAFLIERSLNGVAWSQVATVAANTTAYTDSSLSARTRYYYRVRAVNANTNPATYSAYSNVASATTRRR